MKQNKFTLKLKPSTYVFGVAIALCFAMFVYGLVCLISFSAGGSYAQYMNIMQMVFSLACIAILSIYFSFTKFSSVVIKEPVSIYFMLYLLMFLGAYPAFGWFSNKAALGVFFAFLGMTIALISISVFFAFSKRQNGTVKASPSFLLTFMLGLSTLVVALIEAIVYLISDALDTGVIETLNDFVSQLGYAWIGMVVFAIITLISLLTSKRFVNICLIKQISD